MGGEIGPATDVYAFGVLLFEMFTGAVPFGGETPVAVILAQLHQPPPPPRSLEPSIPEEIESIILTCLAKNPADRYPNARAVIADLEATRQPSAGAQYQPATASSASIGSTANAVMTPSPSNETVWQKVTMDFLGDKLLWNGKGRERARELIQDRLAELNEQGWELVGNIHDPGILQKGQSLRGDTVRGAVFHVKPIRK
jgi:serine/threonine protein kinase